MSVVDLTHRKRHLRNNMMYSRDLKRRLWGGEKAQQVKALAAKSGNLSSVPGTHVVGGEN